MFNRKKIKEAKPYYPILFKYNCFKRRKELTEGILFISFFVIIFLILGIGLIEVIFDVVKQLIGQYLN